MSTIGVVSESDQRLPPDNGESLTIENCSRLEIFSRVINLMPELDNITVTNCDNVILHHKVCNFGLNFTGFILAFFSCLKPEVQPKEVEF